MKRRKGKRRKGKRRKGKRRKSKSRGSVSAHLPVISDTILEWAPELINELVQRVRLQDRAPPLPVRAARGRRG